MTARVFKRHPRLTMSCLLVFAAVICVAMAEYGLRTLTWLGNPPLYEISPLYGYRLKAGQSIEPRGGVRFLFGAQVSTNNLGLRAADYWDGNADNKVLFLGDSVTYGGQYVDDKELFSSVAAAFIPRYMVGNGGVNAWGVENVHGLIVDYGFRPARTVVICLLEGDFYRGLTRISGLPFWSHKPSLAVYDLAMFYATTSAWSRYREDSGGGIDRGAEEKVVDRAVKRLAEVGDAISGDGGRHLIYILPVRAQLMGERPVDPLVKRYLEKYGIDARYLLSRLRDLHPSETDARRWFHDDEHLEAEGHKIYGDIIGRDLAGLLPNR